jgi:hypothetical protein
MQSLTVFLGLLGVAAAGITYGGIYYDFSNGCDGLIPAFGPAYISKPIAFDGEVYALSMITHQVMKIAEDDAGSRSCSVYGYLPTGDLPQAVQFGSFSLGMEVDSDGNIYVTNTGTGPASQDYGSVWMIDADSTTRPIEAVRLAISASPFGLPSGVVLSWRHNSLFYSSETDGVIYRLALADNSTSVWLDVAQLKGTGRIPGQSPDAAIDNTNLLGAPIGAVGLSLSRNGKTLFVGVGDTGSVLEVEIDRHTGAAGTIATAASIPQHTVEGVLISENSKKLYVTSVFANGTSLKPNDATDGSYQGGVLPGQAVWEVDTKTGATTALFDHRLGCATGIMSAKGVLRGGANKIIVASSALDSLPLWPNGAIRNDVLRADYSVAGTPAASGPAFATAVYNGKLHWIRV